jgi:acetate kinase
MKILVLNRGSSSLKSCLYDFSTLLNTPIKPIWEEHLEWKHQKLQMLIDKLPHQHIDVIGHRIVHGGRDYQQSVLIDSTVKKTIRDLADLAPLHNLADLEGIELFEKHFKNVPQVAVFDTAFHHTLPKPAALYPVPYHWYEQGIQRFGFHGTSFQ